MEGHRSASRETIPLVFSIYRLHCCRTALDVFWYPNKQKHDLEGKTVNFNPKINTKALVGIVVIAAAVAGGSIVYKKSQIAVRGAAEAKLEEPEIVECKHRLGLLYAAWKHYRTDHKSQDPPSVEALFPKYLHDPEMLMCPTQKRLTDAHIHLEVGWLKFNNKDYQVSYGFKWMSAGFSKFLQKKGDKIPLIVCTSHYTGTYKAAYNVIPKDARTDSDERSKLVEPVRNAPVLAVRRNGTVDVIDLGTEE